jgi:anti-anti-sigma factor
MDIATEHIDGATVLKISGSFDAPGIPNTKSLLQHIISEPPLPIIIDLSAITFIDSIGLTALVVAFKRCRQLERKLVLCNIQPTIRPIFELVLFDKVFPLFNTREDAIAYIHHSQNRPSSDNTYAPVTEIVDEQRDKGHLQNDPSPDTKRADAPVIESIRINHENIKLLAGAWLERGYQAYAIWGDELLACWPTAAWDNIKKLKPSDVTISTPIKLGTRTIGHSLLIGGTKTSIAQALLESETNLVSAYLTMKANFEQAAKELAIQVRLKTEIEVAARIQRQFLSQSPPQIDELDIYTYSHPAEEVGGDFYDFSFAGQQHHTILFTVGDVSGKGLPAALFMTMTRTILRIAALTLPTVDVQSILLHLNTYLYNDLAEAGMFVTVFASSYTPHSKQLIYANAGHSPIIYCPHDGPAVFLHADAPMVGATPTNPCISHTLPFRPHDILVAGTDGLNESFNTQGEMFGYERLLKTVETLRHLPSCQISLELLATITQFTQGQKQSDDQTLIVIKAVAP